MQLHQQRSQQLPRHLQHRHQNTTTSAVSPTPTTTKQEMRAACGQSQNNHASENVKTHKSAKTAFSEAELIIYAAPEGIYTTGSYIPTPPTRRCSNIYWCDSKLQRMDANVSTNARIS